MSGLAGIYYLDGAPVSPDTLHRMARAISHRGLDGCRTHIAGPLGFAFQSTQVTPEDKCQYQPGLAPNGAVAIFDGRLDNRDDLLARIPVACPAAQCPDVEIILRGMREYGPALFPRLNGDFALAIYDHPSATLYLVRDPVGTRPLYFACVGPAVIFGSEIKAIMRHPAVQPAPNDEALAAFLLHGRRIPDPSQTFFSDVHRIKPGNAHAFSPGRTHSWMYWDFPTDKILRLRESRDYVDAFGDAFAIAVRRRTRSSRPVVVSVSGGVDSSAIYCAAIRCTSPTLIRGITLTYDHPDADEQKFIQDIEHQHTVSISRVPADEHNPLADAATCIAHTESPGGLLWWAPNALIMSAMSGSDSRVTMTGVGADELLFDTAYLQDLVRGFSWSTVRQHLNTYPSWTRDIHPSLFLTQFLRDTLKTLIPPPLMRIRHARSAQRLDDSVPIWYSPRLRQRFPFHPPLSHPTKGTQHARALYETLRSPYAIYSRDIINATFAAAGIDVTYPFLDRDLVAFLMSVPPESYLPSGVPKGLLRLALRGTMPDSIVDRRWKSDFSRPTSPALVRQLNSVRDLISKDCLLATHGYLDYPHVEQQLTQYEHELTNPRTALPMWRILELVGFELWMRQFMS